MSMDPQPDSPSHEREVDPQAHRPVMTLGDLLRSGLVGMWKDREDIGDSVEYARELRDRAWRSQ